MIPCSQLPNPNRPEVGTITSKPIKVVEKERDCRKYWGYRGLFLMQVLLIHFPLSGWFPSP